MQRLRNFFGNYTPFGQLVLSLAVMAIIVDAVICYQYGISQTTMHGIGFALLAVVVAIMPERAADAWNKGARGPALAIAVAMLPLIPVAYQSHLGYSAGVRVGDIHKASAQNVRYDDVRSNVMSLEEQIKFWTARRESLIKQNGWTATVTADALRAKLPGLELAIKLETERRGCKTICEAKTRERDEVVSRIKVLEESQDLSGKIAQATTQLAALREKSAATKTGESIVVNQNNVAAQLYLALTGATATDAIKPDSVTMTFVNTGISGANSLAFMIMAPLLWFVASLERRARREDEAITPAAPLPTTFTTPLPKVPTVQRPTFEIGVGRAIIPGKTA